MTIYLPELFEQDPTVFPALDSALTEPDGLLALGGDLSPPRLIAAYQQGIFPWFGPQDPYLWWSPSKRAVFMPSEFHASRSLQRYYRKHPFTLSINHAFSEVICHCALLRGEENVWITNEMREAYCILHQLGWAHSVELWHHDKLVGGMYGVGVGKIFCAESMFSLEKNASKIVLWKFLEYFSKQGGELLECQILTAHLASLGAKEIPRQDYIKRLAKLRHQPLTTASLTAQFFV